MDLDKYKTGTKRFWAAIVDGIVFLPFLLIQTWIFQNYPGNYVIIGWTVFTSLFSILYSVVLHYKYGQTVGKWVTGIKVIDVSETKGISFKQAVMRDSVYILIELAFYSSFFAGLFWNGKGFSEFYDDYAGIPQLVWIMLELVTMLSNRKRRAIHDFMAHSVVVIKQKSQS